MSKWLHFEVLKNMFEPNDYFSFSACRQNWVLSIKHCSFVVSGHDFTTIIFMIALFQWNLARPFFFFFFSISASSEGNAVREMQECTAWTNKEAKLLQRCHYCKMQWLERAWRLALFLERVVFPDQGVAVASQSVLKLPEKKHHILEPLAHSSASPCIFFHTIIPVAAVGLQLLPLECDSP